MRDERERETHTNGSRRERERIRNGRQAPSHPHYLP